MTGKLKKINTSRRETPKLQLADNDKDEQMIKYGELRRALSSYTSVDIHEDIPVDYYRRVIKACFRANNNGLIWDIKHAASILLYLAFNDGYIKPGQLNADGLKTLAWTEIFLENIRSSEQQKVMDTLL